MPKGDGVPGGDGGGDGVPGRDGVPKGTERERESRSLCVREVSICGRLSRRKGFPQRYRPPGESR